MNKAVAQELQISVTPLGGDEYLVRIEKPSAPGVSLAEEQLRWPVEDWLVQARQLMNDPVLGLLEGSTDYLEDSFFLPGGEKAVTTSLPNLVALGQQLYNALFQGSLGISWTQAQAIAQHQRQILRLRLGLKGTRLPRLPWEVLHAGDRPLATGTDVAFSRYQPGTRLIPCSNKSRSQPGQPLKILMVIAGPSDQESLGLVEEANHLRRELNSTAEEKAGIELTILPQPGREQLTQALEQGQYQVFHYSGHSNLGEWGGDVYLVSNRTGLTETLSGDDLAGLLANNGVQLAVFNSCYGTYTTASELRQNQQERNLAQAMVERGIPAVLAMAERIPDEVALSLTRLLYRNLNRGYPIDLSLSRARQGLISAYGSNQLYWALPVLYLHEDFNGFLTQVPEITRNPEKIWQLPESPDTFVISGSQEALFTPPPVISNSSWDFDEQSEEPLMAELENDENDTLLIDSSDSDPGDADFIRGLFNELNPPDATQESASPISDAVEDTLERELPVKPPNPKPPLPRQSAVTISSAVTTQQSSPPSQNSDHHPLPQRRQGKMGSLKIWRQKFQQPWLLMGLGVTGVMAITVLGLWWFQNRERTALIQFNSAPGIQQPLNPEQTNFAVADTATVVNIAIKQLSEGNIPVGKEAVEALLNRKALPYAKAALDAVPPSQIDDPAVNFLRGRLAWQSLQEGSTNYSVDDVRRFWEIAHQKQPNSWEYLNALGFVYYAQGDFERANNAWLDALELIGEALVVAEKAGDTTKQTTLNSTALTTYAGLALGMWKSAQEQPADKKERLLNESRKFRQKVITEDPITFQPNALVKNWRWSEQAIQDWRSLLAT
ncbi:CHAT domain-containing protein [Lyngbya aestuarii]|uniref:CHAT domain-containing protein n=1 Tax=Lyngbya aestuarii TaxID=118322 RepID=UPI00403E313D